MIELGFFVSGFFIGVGLMGLVANVLLRRAQRLTRAALKMATEVIVDSDEVTAGVLRMMGALNSTNAEANERLFNELIEREVHPRG